MLFSHAFLIATGSEDHEPFVRLLGHGNILGLYGVYTFFIISGFLLARSLAHDADPARFAINRTLRIYPGLVACILATALLTGVPGTSLPWREYLADPGVVSYVTTSISCLCATATLPDVFAYPGINGMNVVVNGSLWSLRFEVLSYLLLAWLWIVLGEVRMMGVALALLATATLVLPAVYDSIRSVNFTLPYFAGGVLMYAVYLRYGLNARVAGVCVAGWLAAAVLGVQSSAYAIFGAYLIAWLGNRPNPGSAFAARAGDLSYGVYLYGWPVEQLVKQYTGTESPWLLMGIALPLVVAAAALSCHLVERPMLRLKEPFTRFAHGLLTMWDRPAQRAARHAATIAFLAGAFFFLTSDRLWWYVTPGLAGILIVSAAGALIGACAAGTWRRLRKQA